MRTKLLMVIILIVAMTGTAVAVFTDELTAIWTGSQIQSDAWDFKIKNDGTPYWYQIRYYPPGTSISSTGYFTVFPPFLGRAIYNSGNHYVEYFDPDEPGDWTVVLMKGGVEGSTPDIISSVRVVRIVSVPGDLELKKIADPTIYSQAGQTITYTYEITNTGTVPLPGPFKVTDDKLGDIDPCGSGPLAIGAKTSCSKTYTITDADLTTTSITNAAIAMGNGASSNAFFTIIYKDINPIPPNQIPEFPTVALPVAAVIGIMFFMQRRKKEK